MSFRNLLITILLGLILVSTGAVAWLGITGLAQAIRQLTRGQMAASLDSVSAQIEGLFDPADRMLLVAGRKILEGHLPIDDPVGLGRLLAHKLAFEKSVTWLSFGYADGSFAGATSRRGKIFINTSTPEGGPPLMREVLPDGGLFGFDPPNLGQMVVALVVRTDHDDLEVAIGVLPSLHPAQ